MTFLPNTRIEIIDDAIPCGDIQHALFDFDGTISLIREGWQQVMGPFMLETLLATPRHEPKHRLCEMVAEYIDRTTGVQTIYQMMGLAEMVRERGAEPLAPTEYKRIYLERLWQRIEHRVTSLKQGTSPRAQYLLPGAEAMLAALQQRGITCYLASGTDVANVRDEAAALGVADYFTGGIYGALDNLEEYSKAKVISQILETHQLHGSALVTFGDGFVEIENTRAAGGIAVGVASSEREPGVLDSWKRERLIHAGAQIIVPDFTEWPSLLDYLCGKGSEASS